MFFQKLKEGDESYISYQWYKFNSRFPTCVEFYIRKYGEDGTFGFDNDLNATALRENQGISPQKQKAVYNNTTTLPVLVTAFQKNLGLDSLMTDLGNFSTVLLKHFD